MIETMKRHLWTYIIPLILFLSVAFIAEFITFPEYRGYGDSLLGIGLGFGILFFNLAVFDHRVVRKFCLASIYCMYVFLGTGMLMGAKTTTSAFSEIMLWVMLASSFFAIIYWIVKSENKTRMVMWIVIPALIAGFSIYGVGRLANYLKDSGLI